MSVRPSVRMPVTNSEKPHLIARWDLFSLFHISNIVLGSKWQENGATFFDDSSQEGFFFFEGKNDATALK